MIGQVAQGGSGNKHRQQIGAGKKANMLRLHVYRERNVAQYGWSNAVTRPALIATAKAAKTRNIEHPSASLLAVYGRWTLKTVVILYRAILIPPLRRHLAMLMRQRTCLLGCSEKLVAQRAAMRSH